jgi:hypothetical protein
MAQIIKQGNIFGRLGSGIGKGLAEQLPKEIERGRLSHGLKELGEKKGLTTFQQFAELAGIPGITPQGIQTGGELLKQQGMLNGAQGGKTRDEQAFNEIRNARNVNPSSETKGLIGTENTQAALQPAIPKSLSDLQNRAAELNQQNPGLYPDYQTAFNAATVEDQQRLGQNAAQQAARQSQKGVETDIRKELRGLQSAANAKVPDNVYQKVENKALEAIRNGSKDELTAAKDSRDELDAISRDYAQIDSFGNLTLPASNPKQVKSSINSLRQKFKANDDLENMADAFVGRNGLSNEYAYYLAKPPTGEINDTIKKIPNIKIPLALGAIGYKGTNTPAQKAEKTQSVIQNIAKMLNKNDSPLAIGYELNKKGYDSQEWRDYLIKNKDELNLSQSQIRELGKVDKASQGFLNDFWLQAFGGE